MAIPPTIKPITAADVASLKNDKVFEVVNGAWKERMMAGELHGAIATNLILAIGSYVKANNLGRVYPGDTTYVLEGDEGDIRTMRLPDVSFVQTERLKQSDREDFYYQAPDLAIEIISPSERTGGTRTRLNDYLRTATHEVWLVYPDTQQVAVHKPNDTATTYNIDRSIPGGDLLPKFSLAIMDIFDA